MILLFRKDIKIHALRMSDERGLELPNELLGNFPDVPTSLEYLNWDTGKNRVFYRLERHERGIRAVHCEPLREHGARESWVGRRVWGY